MTEPQKPLEDLTFSELVNYERLHSSAQSVRIGSPHWRLAIIESKRAVRSASLGFVASAAAACFAVDTPSTLLHAANALFSLKNTKDAVKNHMLIKRQAAAYGQSCFTAEPAHARNSLAWTEWLKSRAHLSFSILAGTLSIAGESPFWGVMSTFCAYKMGAHYASAQEIRRCQEGWPKRVTERLRRMNEIR